MFEYCLRLTHRPLLFIKIVFINNKIKFRIEMSPNISKIKIASDYKKLLVK